jgi:AcrR family transcriptional regulator
VQAAAELMYVNGVNATTLDGVRAASGTSKSQLYRHFPDKDALIHAVIAMRGRQVLESATGRSGQHVLVAGLKTAKRAPVAGGCQLPPMNSSSGCGTTRSIPSRRTVMGDTPTIS